MMWHFVSCGYGNCSIPREVKQHDGTFEDEGTQKFYECVANTVLFNKSGPHRQSFYCECDSSEKTIMKGSHWHHSAAKYYLSLMKFSNFMRQNNSGTDESLMSCF